MSLELLELGFRTRETLVDRSGALDDGRWIVVFREVLDDRVLRDTADGLVVRVTLRRTVPDELPELRFVVFRLMASVVLRVVLCVPATVVFRIGFCAPLLIPRMALGRCDMTLLLAKSRLTCGVRVT